MLIENINDKQTLISLFDSLPSTASALSTITLRKLFTLLNGERTTRLETLDQCKQTLYELRDIIGIDSKVLNFEELEASLNEAIKVTLRPVEFRGLRHPDAGRTLLKKKYRYQDKDKDRNELCEWWNRDDFTVERFKDELYAQQLQ